MRTFTTGIVPSKRSAFRVLRWSCFDSIRETIEGGPERPTSMARWCGASSKKTRSGRPGYSRAVLRSRTPPPSLSRCPSLRSDAPCLNAPPTWIRGHHLHAIRVMPEVRVILATNQTRVTRETLATSATHVRRTRPRNDPPRVAPARRVSSKHPHRSRRARRSGPSSPHRRLARLISSSLAHRRSSRRPISRPKLWSITSSLSRMSSSRWAGSSRWCSRPTSR